MKTVLIALFCFVTLPLSAALPGADALAGLITKQFDTNADSILDQGEWQSGLGQSFGEMDSNGDGSISGAEIDALAGPIGKDIGDFTAGVVTVLIKKIILTMDADSDNSVSLKEYTTQADAFFTKLDTSKSGSLEQAELLELPTQFIKG